MRSRTAPASTSVHGPWQIAPIGLPDAKNARTKRDGVLVLAQVVRVDGAAREQQPVVVLRRGVADGLVDREPVAAVDVVVHGLDLAALQRQQLDLGAGLAHRLARSLELDLLDAVGGEDRDLLALQLIGHGGCSFGGGRMLPRVKRGSPDAYPGHPQAVTRRIARRARKLAVSTRRRASKRQAALETARPPTLSRQGTNAPPRAPDRSAMEASRA